MTMMLWSLTCSILLYVILAVLSVVGSWRCKDCSTIPDISYTNRYTGPECVMDPQEMHGLAECDPGVSSCYVIYRKYLKENPPKVVSFIPETVVEVRRACLSSLITNFFRTFGADGCVRDFAALDDYILMFSPEHRVRLLEGALCICNSTDVCNVSPAHQLPLLKPHVPTALSHSDQPAVQPQTLICSILSLTSLLFSIIS